jgi:hypothetical protein
MELLFCVVALPVLAVLAMRFGYDSRATPESREETWSNLGLRMELTA